MTVSSTTKRNSYTGDGSTTTFAYSFKIFDDDDITVILRTTATGTETVQTKTTHYSVTGVGSASGGNVVFGSAPSSAQTVVLLRQTAQTQATDYTPNDPFPAASHEDALDKLTLMTQDQQDELDRSIKLSRTNTMTSTEFTVGATDRANKILAFDSSGELSVTQELGTNRGDWAASTSYNQRDIVKDTSTGNIFFVNEAHTSSGSQPLTTNANSSKYDLLIESLFSGVTAGTVSASKGVLVDGNKDITGFRNITLSGELTLGSGAVINEAELEAIDGVTAGTVAASKAVVVDSNKDAASFRNITLTGELDAGSLDISGDADIDGTLETDALSINGTAVTATGAELNYSDTGAAVGTVVASKVVTADANKDVASFRNITLTGELDAGSLDVSGDADIDGTLEADAMTLNGTAITATATLDTGISNNNVPKFTSGVADNDFLRVDGTAIEGRSASEVLSDIAAAPAAGDSNIVTTGALNSGSITSGFGAIDNGSSNITTTGVGAFGSLDISGDIDVDGTTNLDAVDIDGAVDIAGNLTVDGGTIKLDGNFPTGSNNVALGDTALDTVESDGTGNTAIGSAAGTAITTGDNNVAVGYVALDATTTGSNNTAVGTSSLSAHTTGSSNVAVGKSALEAATTSSNNTAVGGAALAANTTGTQNTAIGSLALDANTTASRNTAVGYEAGTANTTGHVTAIGSYVLRENTTGSSNVGVGGNDESNGGALQKNTTGSNNTAVGVAALTENTTGASNTAVGLQSLAANTTGASNTAVGSAALDANTTGGENVAVGINALGTNDVGNRMVAVGRAALGSYNPSSATDAYNVGVGYDALTSTSTGLQNTAVGGLALRLNTTASTNTAIGYNAGAATTTGGNNTFLGATSGDANTTGTQNLAIGSAALTANTTASDNAGVGFLSLEAVTTGANNTAVGSQSNKVTTTGDNNTMIGHLCRASSNSVSNEVVLGSNGMVGKGAQTAFISGGNGPTFSGNNSASFSTTSDRRIKKNIEDNITGLDAINQVRVRNFHYRTPDEIDELPSHTAIDKQGIQLGVIAQEIQEILPDVVRQESTGCFTVNPENMTWYLVNAVKELSAKVAELEAKIGD